MQIVCAITITALADGAGHTLPVAMRVMTQWNHARVPVMMPRRSDGNMRRGGSTAARTQHKHPVDERGGVHGVPELSAKADKRVAGKISVVLKTGKEKRRWGTRRANRPRKRPGRALMSGIDRV